MKKAEISTSPQGIDPRPIVQNGDGFMLYATTLLNRPQTYPY